VVDDVVDWVRTAHHSVLAKIGSSCIGAEGPSILRVAAERVWEKKGFRSGFEQ